MGTFNLKSILSTNFRVSLLALFVSWIVSDEELFFHYNPYKKLTKRVGEFIQKCLYRIGSCLKARDYYCKHLQGIIIAGIGSAKEPFGRKKSRLHYWDRQNR